MPVGKSAGENDTAIIPVGLKRVVVLLKPSASKSPLSHNVNNISQFFFFKWNGTNTGTDECSSGKHEHKSVLAQACTL